MRWELFGSFLIENIKILLEVERDKILKTNSILWTGLCRRLKYPGLPGRMHISGFVAGIEIKFHVRISRLKCRIIGIRITVLDLVFRHFDHVSLFFQNKL